MLDRLLYLDHNVISYLRKDEKLGLNKKMKSIYEAGWIVVFSPAHLEEISVSEKRCNMSENQINEEIEFLSKIAGNNALRPVNGELCTLYNESPRDCYKRVVDNYENNDWAENLEKKVIDDANDNPMGSPKELNNLKPEEVLNNIFYKEVIVCWLRNNGIISQIEVEKALKWSFDDLKNRFSIFEAYVNLSANLIEKIGYYREKKEKHRSRLHDVSHMIYAAYSTTFVSSDQKLLNKTKAIYSFLGVPTNVLSLEEFIQNDKL